MLEEKIYIKGNYRRSIYQNNNGYSIGIFKVSDTNSENLAKYLNRTITFTGYFHELNDIDTYIFYGKLVNHEKYGEQFQVENYERVKPEEKDSIIEFLTSGLFKGIGEKKAKKIVDVLGKDTLKVILETPDNLILIPTITKTNIETLHNKLKEYESSYETIIYLGERGFSTKDSMIVYNFYKKKTKEVIEQNIYKLIQDISEMNFKKIDQIAIHMGMTKDNPARVKAAVLYIMEEISNSFGHSYYFKEELKQYLPKVLQIDLSEESFENILRDLEVSLDIVVKEKRYYLKKMYDAETFIVKRIRILSEQQKIKIKNLEEELIHLENLLQIQYNEEQKMAICSSLCNKFFIITGGPGTGKTTIMRGICELYKSIYKLTYSELQDEVVLLAPTGRAAKRMSEATLLRASTIHRFLKWQKETNTFQVNEYNKSKAKMVIVDEASMIDTYLMASLLKGLSINCTIIMVGDDQQLPSVGPGELLRDFIESDMLPVVKLSKLYRQKSNSNIIDLAHDIRNGKINREVFNKEDDLTFIQCSSAEVGSHICEIATTYKDVSYKKFQILAPIYKGLNGIDEINRKIQKIFNPKEDTKKEIIVGDEIFREDDKVIQLINMPDDNIYNGDIGLISHITNTSKKEIEIDFDGNDVRYTPSNFNNFRLAYCISVHKSQGSEFDIVVIPIVKEYGKMLYQRLIYTAVTRSKSKLYLIGDLNALNLAVLNHPSDIRRTTVKEFLIYGIK